MASKAFLLLALAFAVVLLITSEVAAAKDLASNHDSEAADAKYGKDDRGYYNGGGGGGYYNGGGHGGHYNGGGHGGHYKGGGGGGHYKGRGGGGYGGGRCKYGCCNKGYYNRGCRCCNTLAEATAYKQTFEAQTHN